MPPKQQLNLRIDELTRAAIERIAATYKMSKTQVVMRAVMLLEQELGRKERQMKSYRYTPIALDDLTATDLRQEAAPYSIGNAFAATITIYRASGLPEAERAEALYLPDEGRLGIAWGADATWADARDLESGIEMWLNDGEAWTAAR